LAFCKLINPIQAIIRGTIITRMAITFITTTTHGTWLPGDLRGFVRRGQTLPGDPKLLAQSRKLLKSDPVFFSASEQDRAADSILAAADEFGYHLTDLAVEAWHLHWIVAHGDDPVQVMAGRLKARIRQSLDRGQIWTTGYWDEAVDDETALEQIREYISRHAGCRVLNGKRVSRRRA
jgi:hypothetical protein